MNTTEHLLTVLAEESAEVVKDACKAIRFGLHDVNPKDPTEGDNKRRIERELAEVLAVADLLGLRIRDEDKAAKIEKLNKFMAYAMSKGTLENTALRSEDMGICYCPLLALEDPPKTCDPCKRRQLQDEQLKFKLHPLTCGECRAVIRTDLCPECADKKGRKCQDRQGLADIRDAVLPQKEGSNVSGQGNCSECGALVEHLYSLQCPSCYDKLVVRMGKRVEGPEKSHPVTRGHEYFCTRCRTVVPENVPCPKCGGP